MITMSEQFNKLGYTKKTCITCGKDFWTAVDRQTCGDAPCDEYGFIGNPATRKKYDLHSIQKTFLDFSVKTITHLLEGTQSWPKGGGMMYF